MTIDVDSSICETYGLAKQGGAKFTYNHVRGYHPLLAVMAGTADVLHCRLRGGNANSGRGAAGFLTETFRRLRSAGATGPLTLRADSGFYSGAVATACRTAEVAFSITVRLNPAIRKAIATIPDDAWVPIPYFLDGADVAETSYRPFGKKAPLVRLIVRRVKPTPGSQLALLVDYAFHAFVTNRVGETVALEADHRRHAEVENAIRDLKYGVGLNHMPSGRFGANAAWLGLNVMAHNLARWTSRIGLGESLIATDTLRRRYLRTPGPPQPLGPPHHPAPAPELALGRAIRALAGQAAGRGAGHLSNRRGRRAASAGPRRSPPTRESPEGPGPTTPALRPEALLRRPFGCPDPSEITFVPLRRPAEDDRWIRAYCHPRVNVGCADACPIRNNPRSAAIPSRNGAAGEVLTKMCFVTGDQPTPTPPGCRGWGHGGDRATFAARESCISTIA